METSMPLALPEPIANYLTADRTDDPALLIRSFTRDAHVHDESHDYRGIAAIQAWKREAKTKYPYTVEPLTAETTGPVVTLRARLTGTFPGSPVQVTYTFTLANDRIASLSIG